ncbi:cytochrome d ubiquinol oxidase subunit II [Yimella sp. cx-51]|uniref:cytochrome d ubiquinol oxidase subunit II n=1 Tax=Yimella sp. cx-51 TaxID=2770551 RepID=UPI00165E1FE6|nr:cytochrome d ubiquinol oxidase subunit II [Yimella sp. cx-51]MBC9957900.1 cytochrome d ubiquinol oxidase subunit II [Yimella sp. cx-51]QTH38035.1 cytochrome d ubiquinol oxidase subunit II [Yimella sp. cx-51]
MSLETLWFIIIGVLWTGYFVLEGFDFGVGMSLPFLGKGKNAEESDKRKRVLLTTIGPFWDGNEVWLLTAGGATFAAFPAWYGTMFSGFYLALLLILVALIVRNMGFEYRHKRDSDAWRKGWDLCIIIGSLLPPLLFGVALTNLVRGVPITQDSLQEFIYTGSLFTLLNPMSLLGGLVFVGLSLTHGMHFIALKTTGEIRQEANAFATKAGLVTAVLAVALLLWVGLTTGTTGSWITTVLAAVSLLAAIFFNTKGAEGKAFIGTTLTWALAVATYFLALFPAVMPSSTSSKYDLTVTNAASSHLTLQIMTGAALVFTPIALAYTAWNYWVFRKRISVEHIPPAIDPLKGAGDHGNDKNKEQVDA